MKVLLLSCALLVTLGSVACSDDEDAKNNNDVVDDMLNEMRKNVANDTIELEDAALFDFERTLGLFKTKGQASFKKTSIMNAMKFLRREKDAKISWPEGKPTQIKIPLALGPMKFKSTGRLQFLGVGPRRVFNGDIKYVSATLTVTHNATSGVLKVRSLKTDDITGVSLGVDGPGLFLGPAIRSVFYSRAITAFKPMFNKRITKMLEEAFDEVVPSWTVLKALLG